MNEAIRSVMCKVFGLDADAITDETSSDTIEKWDSMRHMSLVLALEEEFSVQFEDTEIPNLLSYRQIVEAIARKTVKP